MPPTTDEARSAPSIPLLTLALAAFAAVISLVFLVMDVGAYNRQKARGKAMPSFSLIHPPVSTIVGSSEFIPPQSEASVRLENFSVPSDHAPYYRFGLGPASTIEVYTTRLKSRLEFTYTNPIPEQEMTISCNGVVLEHLAVVPSGTIKRAYALDFHPGKNVITISYARYNHAGVHLNDVDPRTLAGRYFDLSLYLD